MGLTSAVLAERDKGKKKKTSVRKKDIDELGPLKPSHQNSEALRLTFRSLTGGCTRGGGWFKIAKHGPCMGSVEIVFQLFTSPPSTVLCWYDTSVADRYLSHV